MQILQRLRMLCATVLLAACAAMSATQAQDFPNRPIRFIVAFPAGGPTDFVARILADRMNALLGQIVLVENKPGANAAIGAAYVAKSEPDGYTLFVTTAGAFTINPNLRSDLPYDPVRDFAPVTLIVSTSEILVANPDVPIRTVADLIAIAKAKENGFAMASTGVGGLPHLALELLQSVGGVKILHVPYRGAAPAITDLLGGQVQAMFADLPVVMPQIAARRLRPVAAASRQRTEVLPDLPTLDEQGFPGVYADNWYGLFAPAKTPPPVIGKLNAAMSAALNDPEARKKLLDAGAVPASGTPEALGERVKSDSAYWRKLIDEKGIKLAP